MERGGRRNDEKEVAIGKKRRKKTFLSFVAWRKADAVEKGGKFVEIRQLCLTAPPLP